MPLTDQIGHTQTQGWPFAWAGTC